MEIDSLLISFKHFGVNLGLERILRLLKNLDSPHELVPVIHVAGTNGKGSVCAYLSSILTAAGYRTGRYTSPHLIDWTERICLNEQSISSEELYQLLLQVKAAIDPETPPPTQFEVLTAAAWLYFAQQKVDVAIVEVGLGGRLDATNVCDHPLVTIITSISFDHVQVLGPEISNIAGEKAGILKPKRPVIIGQLPADAQRVVRSRAQELQSPMISPQIARQISPSLAEYCYLRSKGIQDQNQDRDRDHQVIQYPLPLNGEIQLLNSSLALAAVEILQNQGWLISESAIVAGMEKTKWLGRMQWTTWKAQRLLVDGAHNPASAKALRDYVDKLQVKSISWVMGILSTKDHTQIFQALLRPQDKLYLLPVADHSSADPDNLAKLAGEICPQLNSCNIHTDLFSALDTAFTEHNNYLDSNSQELVVLCGSLYLVGYFLANTSN